MNKALWQPSEKRVRESSLEKFIKFVNFEPNKNFKEFWKWSVTKPEIFWSKFWDYSEIIGNKGKEIIRKDRVFNKTKFFPDSKINYSENILKKRTEDIAINFLSEKGFEENITWSSLYEKVCKFSSYLKSLNSYSSPVSGMNWIIGKATGVPSTSAFAIKCVAYLS